MLIRWRILRTMSRLRPRKRRAEISDFLELGVLNALRDGCDILSVSSESEPRQCHLRLLSARCRTKPCERLAAYIDRLSSQGFEVKLRGPQEDTEPYCTLCPLHQGADLLLTQAGPLRLPIEVSQIGNATGRILGESHDVSPAYAPAQDSSE